MNKLTLSIFFIIILSGCSEETKNVEFYVENKSEMKKKLVECESNPGELQGTPNCINAKKAKKKIIKNNDKERNHTLEAIY